MPADEPIYPSVTGYCPMGCGRTLVLSPDGAVMCTNTDCENQRAVRDILATPHTDHIVVLTDDGFTLQHPLRERVEGGLFGCRVHALLTTWGPTGYLDPGTYSVDVTDPEDPDVWFWERLT